MDLDGTSALWLDKIHFITKSFIAFDHYERFYPILTYPILLVEYLSMYVTHCYRIRNITPPPSARNIALPFFV